MRICPYCSGEIRVKDTRQHEEETFRKYICSSCKSVIFTVEFQAEENERFFREWRDADRKKKDERKFDYYGASNIRVRDPEDD